MIVCVCHNVSDRKIRAAVDEGLSTMRELRSDMQVGTCCGKCHGCAKEVLRKCLDEKEASATMFFQGALAA